MKFLIISIPLIISIVLGFKNFFAIRKSIVYGGLFVIASVMIFLTFAPNISIDMHSASFLIEGKYSGDIPVLINAKQANQFKQDGYLHYRNVHFAATGRDFQSGDILHFNRTGDLYAEMTQFSTNNCSINFSFIPGIEEYVRLFPYHVAFAWVGLMGFILSLISSMRSLFTNQVQCSSRAYVYAKFGFIFTILATGLGMIWAKHSWGSFWNWDPRELSIVLLLTIYVSYFVLRSSIDNEVKKAKLSSVYAIFAGLSAPFFIFIMPRLTDGLHPGSTNDSASPLIGISKQSMMNMDLLIVFTLCLCFFTLLFFAIYHKNVENYLIKQRESTLF